MINRTEVKHLLRELGKEIHKDNLAQGAAALAYYLTLSIFPALILLITVVPFLPIDDLDDALMRLMNQMLPQKAYEMVEGVVLDVVTNRRGGLLSLSLVGATWAASMGMYAVMRQLNITYGVEEDRGFVRIALTAVLLSAVFGLVLISGFSLIILGGHFENWLSAQLGFGDLLLIVFVIFRWIIIVLVLLVAFAIMYRYAPNVRQEFKLMTPGSGVVVLLFIGASLLMSLYTQNFAVYSAVYGSIGAMIILMLWLYIVGFVFLLGSEINKLVVKHRR